MAEYKNLDTNTIEVLKSKITDTLASYWKSIGVEGNIILKKAYYSEKSKTQWFSFSAQCPICHNDNETGWCLIGITNHEPYEVSIYCKRFSKSIPYIKEENGKKYVINGSDTYVMTTKYDSDNTAYWALIKQDDDIDFGDFYDDFEYDRDIVEEQQREAEEAMEWEEEHPIYDGDGLTDSQETWDAAVAAAAEMEEMYENTDNDYDLDNDYDFDEDDESELQSTSDNPEHYYVIKKTTGESKIVHSTWDDVSDKYLGIEGFLPPEGFDTISAAEEYLKDENSGKPKKYYLIEKTDGSSIVVYDTWHNVDKNYRGRKGFLPPKKITLEEAEKYLKKD